MKHPLARLRHHINNAIAQGEQPIAEVRGHYAYCAICNLHIVMRQDTQPCSRCGSEVVHSCHSAKQQYDTRQRILRQR